MMKNVKMVSCVLILSIAGVTAAHEAAPAHGVVDPAPPPVREPLIQIGLLLDTSNSMDGLIAQAKSELWRIVNDFVRTTRHGRRPRLEVALYEYGNDSLSAAGGYIRQVLPLTDDLDRVSQELFALSTNGGKEYCGQVIHHAAMNLHWSGRHDDLKVIFIAGNEPFTQGSIDYRHAAKESITRGIVVNTIHCGPYETGVAGSWKHGAQLAEGSYSNIDQDRRIAQIDAPQDAEIARLGIELNKTYIPFGRDARRGFANQNAQDRNAMSLSRSAGAERAVTKANHFYCNDNWDLVDALDKKGVDLATIKSHVLPDDMKKMSLEERRRHV
ncbi:MAG: hypothetical protein CMJ18_27935 [Phycisphaeraceae bacterium]|nr:hypothetical protein [Phycisphaeraceae bacterium]